MKKTVSHIPQVPSPGLSLYHPAVPTFLLSYQCNKNDTEASRWHYCSREKNDNTPPSVFPPACVAHHRYQLRQIVRTRKFWPQTHFWQNDIPDAQSHQTSHQRYHAREVVWNMKVKDLFFGIHWTVLFHLAKQMTGLCAEVDIEAVLTYLTKAFMGRCPNPGTACCATNVIAPTGQQRPSPELF